MESKYVKLVENLFKSYFETIRKKTPFLSFFIEMCSTASIDVQKEKKVIKIVLLRRFSKYQQLCAWRNCFGGRASIWLVDLKSLVYVVYNQFCHLDRGRHRVRTCLSVRLDIIGIVETLSRYVDFSMVNMLYCNVLAFNCSVWKRNKYAF